MKFLLLITALANASTLEYFDSKIDFWGAKQREAPIALPQAEPKESFPWKTYLDPKNKEFFKEGDYTPPEPFMELARNPTDENIKNWFALMGKKNELSRRLEQRMQEYLGSSAEPSITLGAAKMVAATETKRKAPASRVDPARFKLRMYFESTCPHCRRMFSVLKRFQEEGFSVEALEVDSGPVPEAEKIVPIGGADPGDLKKHGVQGVPFLVVADLKRKALLPPVEGYHDYEEVLSLLRQAN
jgi:thiol-disulfide isomerase/thioredoxin